MYKSTVKVYLKTILAAGVVFAAACQAGVSEEVIPDASEVPSVSSVLGAGRALEVTNEYIVVYRRGITAASADATTQKFRDKGISVLSTYTIIPGFHSLMSRDQVDTVRLHPDVSYVEPNKYVAITTVRSDPPYGLDRVDQRHGFDKKYDDFGFSGAGVHTYIIDTGIRTTHSEFAGRIGTGYSAVDGDPSIEDCHGHGTHVASTVAGSKYGVAKDATVHPVRVLDCGGVGTSASVIKGMDWVRNNAGSQPSVVNMSLGGPASTAENDAVKALTDAGIPVVVAAGNDSAADACNSSPASAPSALTVAATDSRDARALFSNVGPCVDLFAPGVGVLGAGISNDNDSVLKSGTSMASPHVAGAVALYLQRYPRLTGQQVHDAIVVAATRGVVTDARSANLFLYTNLGTPAGNLCYGRCGGQSPDFSCGCDKYCVMFGDCCSDFVASCR